MYRYLEKSKIGIHSAGNVLANKNFENVSSFARFLGKDFEELYGVPDISAFKK